MNLLSVDFDYFFPMRDADPKMFHLYDWGHRDAGVIWIETLWMIRAAQFLAWDLELPGTTGEEVGFWDQFKFSPTAELFFADSHQHAANPAVIDGVDMVVSFDAHHDGGYSGTVKNILKRGPDCSSWLVPYYANGANMVVVYPAWRKEKYSLDEPTPSIPKLRRTYDKDMIYPTFDKVFIARSGGWTPSWIDPQFFHFLRSCPVTDRLDMGLTDRSFDMAAVQEQAEQNRSFMATIKKTMKAAS